MSGGRREIRARGGALVAGIPDGPGAATVARTRSLKALRALHAEQRRLQLRRIEVRVRLADVRRTIAHLETAAGLTAQGRAEEIIFEHAARAAAELAIEARAIDQRRYRLPREIRAAQTKALLALLRDEVPT